jgi:hypothetical protein
MDFCERFAWDVFVELGATPGFGIGGVRGTHQQIFAD